MASLSVQEFVQYLHQPEQSNASSKLYDAFISHRGPDVKDTLAKQLYELLKARNCRAFLDRKEIEGGEPIPFAICNGICSSVVQIAIFSKGYATSPWCLNELVLMLEQSDALFIPVFYDVDPWELRHIENEKSVYAAAFSDYQNKGRNLDNLDEWKKALISASNVSGYQLSEHIDNLCEEIVSRVLQEMNKRMPLHVAKYPVGLAELVQDFENCYSETARDKAKIVGIFGLGGSGKTTLAKELLNRKRSGYHASCFLSDVRESHGRGELHCLQSKFLKDIFNEKQEFSGVDEGIEKLEHRLARARDRQFLLVLDDVDHMDQLDALLFEGKLSSGSLVIITTRDQSVLTGADVTIRYRMKGMDRDHGRELFCCHAFRKGNPPFAYEGLVESFVEFCGGLPLSLKVLGAHVYRRDEQFWRLELEKVRKIQPKDIMQRLKISFDGLDSEEKQIFMDIACFFVNKDLPSPTIWEGSGWSAQHAVLRLIDKCLVEVHGGMFKMHDHLRDLGRQLAVEWSPPRLWQSEYLRAMEAKGFRNILKEMNGRCFHSYRDSSLQFTISYFIGNSNHCADTSTALLWLGISVSNQGLQSIPSWFPLQKLHSLQMFGGEVERFCSILLQNSQRDSQVNFQLKEVELLFCDSLQNLPEFIGMLNHLQYLRIVDPFMEKCIEGGTFSQALKQLSNLRSLILQNVLIGGDLDLRNGKDSIHLESCTSSCMNSLHTMYIHKMPLSKLFISGEICPNLRTVYVSHMLKLIEVDLKLATNMKCLSFKDCGNFEIISGLSSLKGLEKLFIDRCDGLNELPSLSHLPYLEHIRINECKQLQKITGIEELEGLKSLVIEVAQNGDAGICNCINGLKRPPSEYTILRREAVEEAESKFNENLFSGVMDAQAVAKIHKNGDQMAMQSSLTAMTVRVLLVSSDYNVHYTPGMGDGIWYEIPRGKWIVTTLHSGQLDLTSMYDVYRYTGGEAKIHKGFMTNVNKGEEWKALNVLKAIIGQLYL